MSSHSSKGKASRSETALPFDLAEWGDGPQLARSSEISKAQAVAARRALRAKQAKAATPKSGREKRATPDSGVVQVRKQGDGWLVVIDDERAIMANFKQARLRGERIAKKRRTVLKVFSAGGDPRYSKSFSSDEPVSKKRPRPRRPARTSAEGGRATSG